MVLNRKLNTSKNKKQMEHYASWTAKSPSVFYFVFIGLFNYENYEMKKKQPVDTDDTRFFTDYQVYLCFTELQFFWSDWKDWILLS